MKASELVKELDSIISRCGDLEVKCDSGEGRRDVEFLGYSFRDDKIVVYCFEKD